MGNRSGFRILAARALIAVVALIAFAHAPSQAGGTPDLAPLFAELNALSTPRYTGGLPSRNRALAAPIRAAMLAQFPAVACPAEDGRGGVVIGYGDDKVITEPPLESLDPNLAALLMAARDARQEVRDTATYAIGQLGPSGKSAIPFFEKKFSQSAWGEWKEKGNWSNDTLGKLSCESIAAPDFQQVIPAALLPPREPPADFLKQAAVLLPTLYLDEDVEYPPGMLAAAFGRDKLADHAMLAARLFARILENDKLSVQKRVETVHILANLDPQIARVSLDPLLRLATTDDPSLKYNVAEALLHLKHPAAISLLAERVATMDRYNWETQLCEYGAAARSAEDALLALIADATRSPDDVRGAIAVLGCVKSRKAVPALLQLLSMPDWETQRATAIALGKIGDSSLTVVQTLTKLSQTHWSKQVRNAAAKALVELGGGEPEIPATRPARPEIEKVTVGGPPPPIDHGLPWCDESGKYSIDGRTWFAVTWLQPRFEPIPEGFPYRELFKDGARQFLWVDDGWLYTWSAGEFSLGLRHITDAGKETELESSYTRIIGMVRKADRIFAFGRQWTSGEGTLFEVSHSDGSWRTKRVAALPSSPVAWATAPSGELLLRDDANSYTVIDHGIVPLKCEKVHAGSYFTNASN